MGNDRRGMTEGGMTEGQRGGAGGGREGAFGTCVGGVYGSMLEGNLGSRVVRGAVRCVISRLHSAPG